MFYFCLVHTGRVVGGVVLNNSTDTSSNMEREVLETSSVQNIYKQITWTNEYLATSDVDLQKRTDLVNFLKVCYETLNLLTQKKTS